MRRVFTISGLAGLFGLAAVSVQASSLPAATITAYDRPTFDGAVAGMASTIAEDFESFTTGEVLGPVTTAVGVFDTLGPTGSGGTVTGTTGNTGKGLFLRDTGVYGRSNTTQAGGTYLDSNDTFGISWTIAGLGLFDHVFFTMSDVADSGATFSLLAGGTQVGPFVSSQRNGAINMVMLSFTTAIDTLTLELRHSKLNDGFSVDDATIGLSRAAATPPSAVPLPPAAALLVAGVGALVLLRRRLA